MPLNSFVGTGKAILPLHVMTMPIHPLREKRIERNWRLVRQTSTISAVVVLTMLLVFDAYFRFTSWRLNVTIALLAVFFLVLLRLDLLLHTIVARIRNRRRFHDHPR